MIVEEQQSDCPSQDQSHSKSYGKSHSKLDQGQLDQSKPEKADPLSEMLKRIQLVLVRTSHPGNIGSAARAMKTMGLSNLALVQPDHFPSNEADWMASGATDILTSAQCYESVAQAVADKHLVIGTSSRTRRIPTPQLTPLACAKLISQLPDHQTVSILFGREASGLDNQALDLCHYHMSVPANPVYPVMNLAMTVQVVSYEIRQAMLAKTAQLLSAQESAHASPQASTAAILSQQPMREEIKMPLCEVDWDVPLASHEAQERFFSHLNQTLIDLGFINPRSPRQTMRRFRRLFQRVHMDEMEVNLLRGLLTAVDRQVKENS